MARLWRDYGAIGAIMARLWRDWRDYGAIGAIMARFSRARWRDSGASALASVEERAFGADAHGDGVHLPYSLPEQAQAGGGGAGGEHDAGVHPVQLGAGHSGAESDAHIHGVNLARGFRGLLAAGGKAAVAAVQTLHLGARSHEHDALAAPHAARIAQEELVAALLADGFHGAGQRLPLVAVHDGAFHHVDALAFRRRARRHQHLLGDVQCLCLSNGALVVDHGVPRFALDGVVDLMIPQRWPQGEGASRACSLPFLLVAKAT